MFLIWVGDGAREAWHRSWWPAGLPDGPSGPLLPPQGLEDGGTAVMPGQGEGPWATSWCLTAGRWSRCLRERPALEVLYASPRGMLPSQQEGTKTKFKVPSGNACLVKMIWDSGRPPGRRDVLCPWETLDKAHGQQGTSRPQAALPSSAFCLKEPLLFTQPGEWHICLLRPGWAGGASYKQGPPVVLALVAAGFCQILRGAWGWVSASSPHTEGSGLSTNTKPVPPIFAFLVGAFWGTVRPPTTCHPSTLEPWSDPRT